MGRWLDSLDGLEVRLTGDFRKSPLEMTQVEVEHVLEDLGAVVVSEVRRTTDVLVSAESSRWKFGSYGTREVELAGFREKGSDGVVIDVEGLLALAEGRPAWARLPQSAPPESFVVGAPYRPAQEPRSGKRDPVLFEADPAAMDRALAGHARTQNGLADYVAKCGLQPLSPTSPVLFDLAWRSGSELWVAEVKSLSGQNEAVQMRLGLGQVLEYAWRLAALSDCDVRAVLAVEHQPHDLDWLRIAEASDVQLTWPPFDGLRLS